MKDKNTEFVSLYEPPPRSRMENFKEVSKDQLQSVINSLSSATCSIDPLPTPIVKQCLDTLLPNFDRIVNFSLLSGLFPAELKQSVIKPQKAKSG